MHKKVFILYIVLSISMFSLIYFTNKDNKINAFERIRFEMDEKNKTKQIVGNYYVVEDNWILGKFSRLLSKNKIEEYAKAINEVSDINKTLGKDTYFVSLPHKTNMLKHLYPDFVINKNNIDINKKAFKESLNLMNLKFIDVDEYFLTNFNEKELEQFYFKTDHHWNGIGAFESFKVMLKKMDLKLSEKEIKNYLEKYTILIKSNKNFIGSYNRKLGFPIKEKEKISYVYIKNAKYEYFINNRQEDKRLQEKDIIASFRDRDSWDYGGAYMRGTDCNILKIKNNKSLTKKKVLVFRDSYQAPTTWLLADVFSQVEIVDPRYIGNLDMSYEELIKSSDSDMVLFMYNSFGFDGMIKEMIDKGIK